MSETTTTTVDEQGRLTIDKEIRQLLGIDGERALVRVDIEVRETLGARDDG